nr:MAG TPA: NADH ubiquinone oxidoreductase, 20 Kd subunit [Bacteriophage sp.]
MIKPYKMYGDFYVPGCPNAFPTEEEAWEYIEENY